MGNRHKHADLIHAWCEGAEIEVKRPSTGSWWDANPPLWDLDYEYRIKPKQPVVRWKWAYLSEQGFWYETQGFYSEYEIKTDRQYIKLEYTRTEFPE
jgi:hypothetical protein